MSSELQKMNSSYQQVPQDPEERFVNIDAIVLCFVQGLLV